MTITEITSKIKGLKSALIFSHNRPDGDTIGSATALRNALISLGINADIVCECAIPEKFNFIDGVEYYLTPDKVTKNYDGFIAVDCSTPTMFGGAYNLFSKSKNTFNIDHHISNTKYAKYNYVCDNASNSENVYELIKELKVDITEDIANSLLLGIVTDTGNFAHSNTTDKTLTCAAELMKKDANLNYIVYKMFKDQSKERAKLFSKVMSKMGFFLEDKVAVIEISKSDILEAGASENMTEGFIDFPMSISGVEVAISLLEVADKRYKISLRSKGKVNVNEIASLYGGGGHILASGAMLGGYKEDIIDKLVYNVSQRLE